MDLTERAVSRFLRAIGTPSYDIGVAGSQGGMLPGHDSLTAEEVLKRLPFFRHRNSRGEHIYVRPAEEHACTLLDDLDRQALRELDRQGFILQQSSRQAQATSRRGYGTPRFYRKICPRWPRESWRNDSALTLVRRTGVTSAACRASPTPS